MSSTLAFAVEELSLERCVELALQRNEAMIAAQKNLDRARTKVREKTAGLWPSLDLAASYTRLPYASTSKASILGSSLDDYALSLTLTQPIYAGGSLLSARHEVRRG